MGSSISSAVSSLTNFSSSGLTSKLGQFSLSTQQISSIVSSVSNASKGVDPGTLMENALSAAGITGTAAKDILKYLAGGKEKGASSSGDSTDSSSVSSMLQSLISKFSGSNSGISSLLSSLTSSGTSGLTSNISNVVKNALTTDAFTA